MRAHHAGRTPERPARSRRCVPGPARHTTPGRCRATRTPGSRGGAARRALQRGTRHRARGAVPRDAHGAGACAWSLRLVCVLRPRGTRCDCALRLVRVLRLRGTRRDCVLRLVRVLRLRGTRRACGVQPVRTVHAVRGTAIVTRRRSPCSRRHDREKRFGCCEGVRMGQNLGFADAGHTLPSACACTGPTLPSACACAGHTLPSACACAGHTLPNACDGYTLPLCQVPVRVPGTLYQPTLPSVPGTL